MAARLADLTGLPGWPRLLSREQAASYIGVSVGTFDLLSIEYVRVRSRRLWDRMALDRWVDRLSGDGQDGGPTDWLARLDDEDAA